MRTRTGFSVRSRARPAASRGLRRRPRPMARRPTGLGPRPRRGIRPRRRPTYRPGGYLRYRRWWATGIPRRSWDLFPSNDVAGAPAAGGLSAAARHSLRRMGLLRGIWRRRLTEADPELVRFINRFHQVAGVERVIEDFYGNRYQRGVAQMAIRLSHRLAGQDPDFVQNLHFDRRLTFAPDGSPILTIVAGHRDVHYRCLPWRRLNGRALRRQLRRDMLVFRRPDRVRWVFNRLMPATDRLAGRVRRVLGDEGGSSARPWLAAMDRVVTTI